MVGLISFWGIHLQNEGAAHQAAAGQQVQAAKELEAALTSGTRALQMSITFC